jgi:hypothetical protein
MKTIRKKFSGAKLFAAIVITLTIGELVGWQLSKLYDVHFNPVLVGALCVGGAAAVMAWLYEGADVD